MVFFINFVLHAECWYDLDGVIFGDHVPEYKDGDLHDIRNDLKNR